MRKTLSTLALGLSVLGCAGRMKTLNLPVVDPIVVNDTSLVEKVTNYPVPVSVIDEYTEFLKLDRHTERTVAIDRCTKGSKVIFDVYEILGFGYTSYRYDLKGKFIEKYYADDVIDGREKEPKIKIREYECRALKEVEMIDQTFPDFLRKRDSIYKEMDKTKGKAKKDTSNKF